MMGEIRQYSLFSKSLKTELGLLRMRCGLEREKMIPGAFEGSVSLMRMHDQIWEWKDTSPRRADPPALDGHLHLRNSPGRLLCGKRQHYLSRSLQASDIGGRGEQTLQIRNINALRTPVDVDLARRFAVRRLCLHAVDHFWAAEYIAIK